MKTSQCHILVPPKLSVSALVAVTCALSVSLLNPNRVCAKDTAAPPTGSNPLYIPTIDSTSVVFELRDAPVRQGLEMLLQAGRSQYSIDNKIAGFMTMQADEKSLRSDLDLLCVSCATPLNYKYDKGVFLVGLKPSDAQSAPAIVPTVAAPSQPPTSVTDVPRRVAGVLLLKSGQSYAILEIGTPYGSNTRVMVVSINAEPGMPGAHVPSGVAGVADLLLTGIDATGVTLSGEDGTKIHVPLAGAVSH